MIVIGKEPIISEYVPEIPAPTVFITLNLTTDDISIETTTNIDPIYPNISIIMEVSIIISTILSFIFANSC